MYCEICNENEADNYKLDDLEVCEECYLEELEKSWLEKQPEFH